MGVLQSMLIEYWVKGGFVCDTKRSNACWANKEPGKRDSIWLIFTEATGVEGAEIKVNMTCYYTDDKGKPMLIEYWVKGGFVCDTKRSNKVSAP